MGRRGPAAVPDEIKARRGSWRANTGPDQRKRRGQRSKPAPRAKRPRPPEFLDAQGKATWKRLAGVLGDMSMLSDSYRELMAGMCQQWSRYVRLSRMLNNPHMSEVMPEMAAKLDRQANDALRLFMQIADRFGLSPSAITRITVEKPAKTDEDTAAKLRLIRGGRKGA